MLARVLKVGLLAGLVAGLAIALLQQVTTTPLILVAETFESVAPADHHHDGHAYEAAEGWKPETGLPRLLFTGLATIVTAVGISFLLLAAMLVAGATIDHRRSLGWALAGFAAVGLAPAAGLAPELPGSAAADLLARQAWWIATALATALALAMLLLGQNKWMRGTAVVLLLAPHVIGAPQPHVFESKIPAELAAHFAALSLIVQGLLWTLAGIAIGWLWPRFSPKPLA